MTTTAHAAPIPDADDELLTQIIARRKRRTPFLTLTLAIGVAAAAAFVGGVEIQKHYGATSSSAGGGANSNLAALASRFGRSGATGTKGSFFNGQSGKGTGAATFLGGGATVGTVTLVKGNDLYVTDSSGNTTIVHAKSARVTKSVTGSVKSIAPGDTVTIVGTQGSNGSTTARSITVNGNG